MAPIRRAAQRPDFSSHPTDLELIENYLRARVSTGKHPWKFIHDADAYAADPDDLTAEHSAGTASDGLKSWYFFTTLRAKGNHGKRKERTVASGKGCWHSERAPKPVVAGITHSRQVGYRQAFSFMVKEDGKLVRSGWLMAEIGLNDGPEEGSSEEQLVLCKVYRSPRAGPAPGPKKSAEVVAAAAAAGIGPAIAMGKAGQSSASVHKVGSSAETEEKATRRSSGTAPEPLGSSTHPVQVFSSDAVSEPAQSDSEDDSSSQGGRLIRTPPTTRTPLSESCEAPAVPFPIRARSPASQISDAPPSGFYHPTDEELIKTYLIPRVASGEHPWKFIHNADVYSADPADITAEYSPATAANGNKAWYFFSSLRAKGSHGKRKERTVATGEGCWHSEYGVKAVVDGSSQIGRRQFFSFMKKDDGDEGRGVRTGWIMVEIGLKHAQEESSSDELVLCKVYRTPRVGASLSAKKSTAAAAPARKRKADHRNSGAVGPVLKPDPDAKRSEAAVSSSGRERKTDHKNSDAGSVARRLCSRCGTETDDEVVEELETRGSSETRVLEEDSTTDDSDAPHGGETDESSGSGRPFFHFV